MLTSEAIVLEEFNQPLVIKRVIIPDLQSNQVLVKIKYASICGSQLYEWRGERDNQKWLPHLLGHEAFAEIVEINSDNNSFFVGQKVIISWLTNGLPSGVAPTYKDINGKVINAGKNAVFATYSVVSIDRIFPAHPAIEEKLAPLFGCAIPTGGGMVYKSLDDYLGGPVLVKGFGGIGMASAACLKILGIKDIRVSDFSLERLNVAVEMGFTPISALAKPSSSNQYELIFETTGSARSIEESFNLLAYPGKLVFASHPPKGSMVTLDPYDLIKGRKIEGTWGGGIKNQKEFTHICELMAGHIELEHFVGKEFNFREVNQAIAYTSQGHRGRALLNFELA
jgi:S-(hydroxymethyl)glutathione dehydrogenase / alcohol dehydrogenase